MVQLKPKIFLHNDIQYSALAPSIRALGTLKPEFWELHRRRPCGPIKYQTLSTQKRRGGGRGKKRIARARQNFPPSFNSLTRGRKLPLPGPEVKVSIFSTHRFYPSPIIKGDASAHGPFRIVFNRDTGHISSLQI